MTSSGTTRTAAPPPDAPPAGGREAAVLRVRGAVQGVGFRPFVHRLAVELGLAGSVRNAAGGVVIRLEGPPGALGRFRRRLGEEAPPGAVVEDVEHEPAVATGAHAFVIEASEGPGDLLARVPRDLALCEACRAEVTDPADRRSGYALASCTRCGPRFSIVDAMPYDRSGTSMARFPLCAACARDYASPADRRFHAESVACGACGPELALRDAAGTTAARGRDALREAAALLRAGRIVAVKGLGGFQLCLRADDAAAVARLRARKRRPAKPLAVMVDSLAAAERLVEIDPPARGLLLSAANPIVVLERRRDVAGGLPAEIAPDLTTLGVLLPTTPLHHLLLAEVGVPLVATSGNASESPVVTDERHARTELDGIADAFLVHDRPIVHRADDSVARLVAGAPVLLRLARGYAPLPLPALERRAVAPPVLAVGAHQKVALALWTGAQAVLGPHVGDMDGAAARDAFSASAEALGRLYRTRPRAIACDLHPDLFTTRWAEARGVPLVRVQHHHAHAVACMVEHDLLDRPVLAVTWDGTGWGPDGTVWGGEILLARAASFTRLASLLPFPLPGGEAAIRQPRRVALALLAAALGSEAALAPAWLERLGLTRPAAAALLAIAARGVRSPRACSVGRLFDGVAALALGALEVSYEGEAAVRLEAVADPAVTNAYPLPTRAASPETGGVARGDWRPLVRAAAADVAAGTAPGIVAARFHNALAGWPAAVLAGRPERAVVLSGGCFQNARLSRTVGDALERLPVRVFRHGQIPPNDGGLSAGQLGVALARLGAGAIGEA